MNKIPGHSFFHSFYERISLPATPAEGTIVTKTLFRAPEGDAQVHDKANAAGHNAPLCYFRNNVQCPPNNANQVVFACVAGEAKIKGVTVCNSGEICPIIYSTYVLFQLVRLLLYGLKY